MKKIDLLENRGLSPEEIEYIILSDSPAYFNIFNPPRFGSHRCFLIFFPNLGAYFLGWGPKAISNYVGDRGSNYAILWTAQGNPKELETCVESQYIVTGREMYGIEFSLR